MKRQGVFDMKIIRAKDYADLSRKAANIIAAQVILKPESVLGLATGSSPLGLYAELIKGYESGDLDFSRIRTVNLDEYRGLTPDNDQSYAYFMRENLFRHINIDPANTNVPNGMEPDADKECSRYDAVIEAMGGVDIQLLGIGLTGHIGFNEPAPEFKKGTNCVNLDPKTIESNARFFQSIDDVPKQAYTMGIQSIMKSRKILLIANGEGKADILYRACCGAITPQVPASVLQLHPDVIVVADEPALKVITEKSPSSING